MRRPRGITLLAVLFTVVGIGWVAEACRLAVHAARWWDFLTTIGGLAFILLWTVFCSLWAAAFLAAAYGLWHLRSWARALVLALAGPSSLTFLVGLLEWSYTPPSDVLTRFQVLMQSSQGILLMPYTLVTSPIRELAARFFGEHYPYTVDFVVRFFVGGVGYALIVLYLLRAGARQAFSTVS